MQVFCPYANTRKNAYRLDCKRANKQILEIIQILAVNTNHVGILKKWNIIKDLKPNVKNRFSIYKRIKKHPNTKLWKGNEQYLLEYLYWLLRKYREKNKKIHKCESIYEILLFDIEFEFPELKHLNSNFCINHQKILLEKRHDYYKNIF